MFLSVTVLFSCFRNRPTRSQMVAVTRSRQRAPQKPLTSRTSWHRLSFECSSWPLNDTFHYNSPVEKQFPIAYVVLIHHQKSKSAVRQYMRLLKHLYRPQNLICLHIDRKAPEKWRQAIEKFARTCYPKNILIPKKSAKVVYASPSTLNAHLVCLKELLQYNHTWRYVIDLHGTELPLVTNRDIVEAFKKANGVNIVPFGTDIGMIDNSTFTYKQITHKAIVSIVDNRIKITDRNGPTSAFSRDFVKFIFSSPKAIALRKYLQDVMSAEEYFFSTLNNLPEAPGGWLKRKQLNFELPIVSTRIFQQNNDDPLICRAKHYRHSICVVSTSDINWLEQRSEARSQFFHNKYISSYNKGIMDYIERNLVFRNENEEINDYLSVSS
uniref:Protein xylosyltransferase n=1 Tax=Amphimedon queenslandica TaxID=400682 RepID=A0A1X7TAI8_AMPQE